MKAWIIDHLTDLLLVGLTIVGLYVAWQIPVALNKQDSEEQLTAQRSMLFEADIAATNALLPALGNDAENALSLKQSSARSINEFSNQGRVYVPITSTLLIYLAHESDPKTHCYLSSAIDTGLKTPPKALGANAATHDIVVQDEDSWGKTVKRERTAWKAAALPQTDRQPCDSIKLQGTGDAKPIPVVPPTTTTSEIRQYLDVGCGEINAGNRHISIDENLAKNYQVTAASVAIESSSNLKDSSATINTDGAIGANVQFRIVGLDRQMFGNCPGGGHGTLVVRFQLTSKASAGG